jgi:phosphatidylinositol-3-phosphatase
MNSRPQPGKPGRIAAAAVGAVIIVALVVASLAGSGGPIASQPPGDLLTARPARASAVATAGRPSPAQRGTPGPPPAMPAFGHVYLIVMENKEYGSIVGNAAAPFLSSLIRSYGLARRYDAVAHPSEPNYVALFSGSTNGVADDGVYHLAATNLADQLEAAGRTWRVFAENVPLGCYTGTTASGGADGPGTYARKHEPAISFTAIASDPARCARITNLSHFDPAAADFELIIPNLCHDMHDCSVATGDRFLRDFVPRITGSPAFAGSALFITWDEGTSRAGGGGHVATIVVSPLVAPGTVSDVPYTHASLLRTIEDAWDLGCLAQACQATDLRELFSPT